MSKIKDSSEFSDALNEIVEFTAEAFISLLNLDFMKAEPARAIQIMAQQGKILNISEHTGLLQRLFDLPKLQGEFGEEHYGVATRLASHFGLTVETEIADGETIFSRFISQAASSQLAYNLWNLNQAKLLTTILQKHSNLKLLASKCNNTNVSEVINLLELASIEFVNVFDAFKDKFEVLTILKPYSSKINFAQTNARDLFQDILSIINKKPDLIYIISLLKNKQLLSDHYYHKLYYKILEIDDRFKDHSHTSVIKTLETIKKEYGITFPLNQVYIINNIIRYISSDDLQDSIKKIEDLGFEFDKKILAITLSQQEKISFLEAVKLLKLDKFDSIPNEYLRALINSLMKDKVNLVIEFTKLNELGFTQWEDTVAPNDDKFFVMMFESVYNLRDVISVLSAFDEIKNFKFDFSYKNKHEQNLIDLIRGKSLQDPSDQSELSDLIKVLAKFDTVDLTEASIKILNSYKGPFDSDLFLKSFDLEKVDLLREIDGQTLIEKLLVNFHTAESFTDFLNLCKAKFSMDLNAPIGSNKEHILSYAKQLSIDALNKITNELGIKIDWGHKSKDGTKLFAKIVTKLLSGNFQDLTGYESFVTETIKNNAELELHKSLDAQGNNLPLLIHAHVKKIEQMDDLEKMLLVEGLLMIPDKNGDSIFDVNYKNINGDRLIDVVAEDVVLDDYRFVEILRNYGSFEPKNSIGKAKLDLSNTRLDGYKPNIVNAPQILKLLYDNFPLTNEEIDQIITDFKAKDFGDWRNTEWDPENPLTIAGVVDKLVSLGNVHDRLTESWDFKKVIASVIHVVNKSQNEELQGKLVNCLLELKMCDLGKLMNLLYVVQDEVLGNGEVNYAEKDFAEFQDVLDDAMTQIKEAFGDKANEAIKSWVFSIYGQEQNVHFTSDATKVQGIINKCFAASGSNLVESYHYTKGLWGVVIPKLIAKILPGAKADEKLSTWQESVREALQTEVEKLLMEVVKNPSKMKTLLEDITIKKPHFVCIKLSKDLLEKYSAQMKQYGSDKANKFLELVKGNLDIEKGFSIEELELNHDQIQDDQIQMIGQNYSSSDEA
jgi:hypothetical protein